MVEPGELLLVHTDGITDARSPQGDGFGEARLERIAGTSAAASAAGLLVAIDTAVGQHTAGADPFDDVTLLAAKRTL